MINSFYKTFKAFVTYDYFWRCFKVVFYTLFLELYYLLYFSKVNLYAPFLDSGISDYKTCLCIELGLSFFYLFLLIGGIFKYQDLDEKHHKVWFWIFIVFIGLWYTTVWYKFSIMYVLASENGLLYRSPLQNILTYWFFGIKAHYEPGLYLVHQTFLSINIGAENVLDFSGVLDSQGYVDTTKFHNFVCDHKSSLLKHNTDIKSLKSIIPYVQALDKFNQYYNILIFFGNNVNLDQTFFYYLKF